ncbi:hypothetical protein E2C01_089359 [Portunus trituberculatus]|uniref:Uncharacterized protein n=1 Tax=Portunus trituberculatus TaxID=210409 RepID=A0A5B7JIL7_PORTR|nr:hypothetical protein [Portunus trituberculatus]
MGEGEAVQGIRWVQFYTTNKHMSITITSAPGVTSPLLTGQHHTKDTRTTHRYLTFTLTTPRHITRPLPAPQALHQGTLVLYAERHTLNVKTRTKTTFL